MRQPIPHDQSIRCRHSTLPAPRANSELCATQHPAAPPAPLPGLDHGCAAPPPDSPPPPTAPPPTLHLTCRSTDYRLRLSRSDYPAHTIPLRLSRSRQRLSRWLRLSRFIPVKLVICRRPARGPALLPFTAAPLSGRNRDRDNRKAKRKQKQKPRVVPHYN